MPTILGFILQDVPQTGVIHRELIPWLGAIIVMLLGIIGWFMRYHFGANTKALSKLSADLLAHSNSNNAQINRMIAATQNNFGILNGRVMVIEDRLSIANRHKEAQMQPMLDDHSFNEETP